MKLFTLIIGVFIAFNAIASIGPKGHSTVMKVDGTADANSLEKEFINVINNEGSSIPAGAVVSLDASVDDGASVIIDTTAGLMPLCIMVNACADNALCLCQTYGLFDSALFHSGGGTATAGKPFYLSTRTAGYIEHKAAPAATDYKGGVFYDASSSSGAVQVFINMK